MFRARAVKRSGVIGEIKMKNTDLKQIYDKGDLDFHNGFEESLMLLSMIDSWQGLNVLEIGCGEGHLCSILSYAGADVIGIDYSANQISRAECNYPSLTLWNDDYKDWAYGKSHPFDVIVMQGVLEHFDRPWDDLRWIMDNLLNPSGSCLLSVPNWVNPRGYIYHTLRLLFDAKMSLTDLHYFLPDDFETWNTTAGDDLNAPQRYQIKMESCDYSWAAGPEMIADLKDRIPKAVANTLHYKGYEWLSNLDSFLTYANRMTELTHLGPLSGANLGVLIRKEPTQ